MPVVPLAVWLCLGLGLSSASSAAPDDGPSKMVVLTGILRSRMEKGPPGYGETPKLDRKVVIFVLRLPKPQSAAQLSLPRGGKLEGMQISEVQLWCDSTVFPSCNSVLKKSIGHRITVSGQATPAAEPADYLQVVFHVHLITNE